MIRRILFETWYYILILDVGTHILCILPLPPYQGRQSGNWYLMIMLNGTLTFMSTRTWQRTHQFVGVSLMISRLRDEFRGICFLPTCPEDILVQDVSAGNMYWVWIMVLRPFNDCYRCYDQLMIVIVPFGYRVLLNWWPTGFSIPGGNDLDSRGRGIDVVTAEHFVLALLVRDQLVLRIACPRGCPRYYVWFVVDVTCTSYVHMFAMYDWGSSGCHTHGWWYVTVYRTYVHWEFWRLFACLRPPAVVFPPPYKEQGKDSWRMPKWKFNWGVNRRRPERRLIFIG